MQILLIDQAAKPLDWMGFWCNHGANRVEGMEIMDVMDSLLSTP